ncbi:MAG: hypothetical protein JWM95_3065 [Gemmatimonadetes bacterium]|nr:hypothetical protein [Gemmatimonadota bacterium]
MRRCRNTRRSTAATEYPARSMGAGCDLAAATSHLSGRIGVSCRAVAGAAGAVQRDGVRVGRIHGVLPGMGRIGQMVRARPTPHSRPGESPACHHIQPHVRARLLGIRAGNRAVVVSAGRARAECSVGSCPEKTVATHHARRPLCERGIRTNDLYGCRVAQNHPRC